MLNIEVPNIGWVDTRLSLDSLTYIFEYRFNERDNRYRLNIYKEEGEPVIEGVVVTESVGFLAPYYLPDFEHGDLILLKVRDVAKDLTRDNLGIGQDYEVFYLTNEEIEELIN